MFYTFVHYFLYLLPSKYSCACLICDRLCDLVGSLFRVSDEVAKEKMVGEGFTVEGGLRREVNVVRVV